MNVYQKLNQARAEFHKKALKKSGHNKFAGYNYFELGDFVIPAIEIFNEVGLTSIIRFGKEIAEFIVVNVDKPEEIIVFTSPMSEANLKGCHPVQNLGAVQTYISRYLWTQVLHLLEHDQLDATTGSKVVEEEGTPDEGRCWTTLRPLKQLQPLMNSKTSISEHLLIAMETRHGRPR